MIKKTITVTNPFTGETQEEVHYFNLTQAEIVELDAAYLGVGGFREQIKLMGNGTNVPVILDTFRDILTRAHGSRVVNSFVKDGPEETRAFLSSEAYSKLFMDIVQGEEDPVAFIQGVLPQEVNSNAGKTPSQLAREASEAQMRGHQQKKAPAKNETVELDVAEPVLEKQEEPHVPSFEEYQAFIRSQKS